MAAPTSACSAGLRTRIRRPVSNSRKVVLTIKGYARTASSSKERTRSLAQGATVGAADVISDIATPRSRPAPPGLAADERHELEKPDFGGRSDDNRLIEVQHLLMIHDDDKTVALEGL